MVGINSLESDQTQGKARYLRSRVSGEAGYCLHLLRTTSWSPSDFVGSNHLSTLPVSPICLADLPLFRRKRLQPLRWK